MTMKKVLILGVSGMLGHKLFMHFFGKPDLEVFGTARSVDGMEAYYGECISKIRPHVDAEDFDTIIRALASVQPDIVINCIGLIKQTSLAEDPLSSIKINALLPHRISLICRTAKVRLIHISTDCVFDGRKGNYLEADISNATDLYGRTKFLGEVTYQPHCLTLRTSIIGHELKLKLGLVEWFLAQEQAVKGFKKAIYTGFPTVELADIIYRYVLPNENLQGLYQLSSEPISKHELLRLIAEIYGKHIDIKPYEDFICDRSLDSSRFRKVTGFTPPSWRVMIQKMFDDHKKCYDVRSKIH